MAAHFLLSSRHQKEERGKTNAYPTSPDSPPVKLRNQTRRPRPPDDALMPLWWMAPFFDHTSFGKEASTIILGGLRSGSLHPLQLLLETTQGDCNYSLDTSMPYPDYYELDQAVKRGRQHLDQWIIDHGLKNHGISKEAESEMEKYAEMIIDSSEAGRQERMRIQALKQLGKLLKDQVIGATKEEVAQPSVDKALAQKHAEMMNVPVENLPPRVRDKDFDSMDARDEGAIVVCHSLPPFWARPLHHWQTCAPCPPIGYISAYAIGRAMAETDIYNPEFVKSCNTMDEIWVPSKFSLDVIRRSGVVVPIRIVPIAVNTSLFDPASTSQLRHLPIGDLVIGQHRRLSPSVLIKRDSDDIGKQIGDLKGKILALEEEVAKLDLKARTETMMKQQLRIIKPGLDEESGRKEAQRLVEEAFKSKQKDDAEDLETKRATLLKEKEEIIVLLNEIDPAKYDDVKQVKEARPSSMLQIVNQIRSRSQAAQIQNRLPGSSSRLLDRPSPHRRLKPFCFISTFKWEERKGWKTLLSAYLQEFSSSDDVELYILTKPFSNIGNSFEATVRTYAERELDIRIKKNRRAWWDESDDFPVKPWSWFGADNPSSLPPQKTSTTSPSLYIISHHLSNDEYAKMYKSCQAYVSPSRGEGWGMPVTEAMSMGLPVLVTNWSGLADFVDDSVGRLLNFTLQDIPRSKNIPWWFWSAKWAVVDVDDLRRAMREAYEQPELTREKGRAARKRMETLYSPAAVSKVVARELERIRAGIKSGLLEGYRTDRVLGPHDTASQLDALYTGTEPFSIPELGIVGLFSCSVCIWIILAIVAFDIALLLIVFWALVAPVMRARSAQASANYLCDNISCS